MATVAPPESLQMRLSLLQSGDDKVNDIDEVLVVAFGSNDRYYLCWKDGAGKIWQDSHGLPPELHSWLFMEDEATRDFATLQVMLGQGDEFYAFDKDGKISHLDLQLRPKSLINADKPTRSDPGDIFNSFQADPPSASTPRPPLSSQRRRTFMGHKERPLSLVSSAPSWTRSRSTSLNTDLAELQSSPPTSPTTIYSRCSCQGDPSSRPTSRPQYHDIGVQTSPVKALAIQVPLYEEQVQAQSQNLKGGLQEYFRSESYQLGDFFK